MSSKHILGIGQLEPGKVVIIHGNALECDHGRPIASLVDCQDCLLASRRAVGELDGSQYGSGDELRLTRHLD